MDCKLLSYSGPLSRCSEIGDDLMAELLNGGLADLGNEVTDGVAKNPEAIREGLVGITSYPLRQDDGHLHAYRQGFMVVGVLFCNTGPQSSDELLEHG